MRSQPTAVALSFARTPWQKHLAWGALAALVGALALAGTGCATPEQRHRLLSFFFDGVPPLHPAEPAPEALAAGGTAQRGPVVAAVIVSVHDPFADKDCDLCHAAFSNTLREEKQSLCWSCHDVDDFSGDVIHPPVAAGYCVGCHSPHRSQFQHLLLRTEAELCTYCHDSRDLSPGEAHRDVEGEDCRRCHEPHASDAAYLLRQDDSAS
ncbi:MAG: cytochrome c3 family protein [Myxococcales bacterium]|nr:cytochrome c3 family protein [Myxococcales bacterium]MDH5306008.1 cytochrome c3 family protein [Myxococcales bacterium]MDH5566013.1 cytochrome c3 family protein [Myxococcales bacterium]